jgi:hypothetical protein
VPLNSCPEPCFFFSSEFLCFFLKKVVRTSKEKCNRIIHSHVLTLHTGSFLLHRFILASPRCTLTRNGQKKGEEFSTTSPRHSYHTQVHAYYTLRILTTHLPVKVASAVGNVPVRVVRLHTHTHRAPDNTYHPAQTYKQGTAIDIQHTEHAARIIKKIKINAAKDIQQKEHQAR